MLSPLLLSWPSLLSGPPQKSLTGFLKWKIFSSPNIVVVLTVFTFFLRIIIKHATSSLIYRTNKTKLLMFFLIYQT